MFYRDLILTVQPGDVQFFMNQLLTLVHEKHHRLPVAIALPQFEPAQPNRTDTYDNPRHARMGKVLRLFHPVAYVLDAAIDLLGIQELVDKHVLFVTPTQPAPNTGRTVAFCRARLPDSAARQNREDKRTGRDKEQPAKQYERTEKVLAARHLMAYLPVRSTSGHNVSVFFVKKEGGVASTDVNVNSYGLSRMSEPCYMPAF